jgi:hypothetical protein
MGSHPPGGEYLNPGGFDLGDGFVWQRVVGDKFMDCAQRDNLRQLHGAILTAVCHQDNLAGRLHHGLLHLYSTQIRIGRTVLDSKSGCAEEISVSGKGSQLLGKKRSYGAQLFMFENSAKQDGFDVEGV